MDRIILCNWCNKNRKRTTRRSIYGRLYYYTNSKIWKNSNICADCNIRYVREFKKTKLVPSKEYKLEKDNKNRVCRVCKELLEGSRYFTCKVCTPVLSYDDVETYTINI